MTSATPPVALSSVPHGHGFLGKLAIVGLLFVYLISTLICRHSKRWVVDRATLKKARALDAHYAEDPEYLDYLAIYFANRESRSNITDLFTDPLRQLFSS